MRWNPKKDLFIEAFNPEAADWQIEAERAGRQVGYSARYARAVLMREPYVIRRLKYREEYGMDEVAMNRRLRKDFWKETMDEKQVEMKDRLRASELWGKAEGDFVHRVEADLNIAKGLEEKLNAALEEENGSDGSGSEGGS